MAEPHHPEESHVALEMDGAVDWLRLNRPDKLNPIGSHARHQLDSPRKHERRAEAARGVVQRGTGRAY